MFRQLLAIAIVALVIGLSGVGLGLWGPENYVETEDGKPSWVSFTSRLKMLTRAASAGVNPFRTCDGAIGQPLRPPVSGEAELGFGVNEHPMSKKLRHHAGVDFERPSGTPVQAAAAGRVSFAHQSGPYGTLVIVTHDAQFETLYAHLSTSSVRYGQCVAAGETIGLVGSTGLSETPHLHFEIRRDGVAVNPDTWVPGLAIR